MVEKKEDVPMTTVINDQLIQDLEEAKKGRERAPRAKQGKLIVRNLGFDLKEKHLTALFKKFGPIVEINVPLNPTTKQNRGFGFVEFEKREDAFSAITELHGTKYKGRDLTVEFSVSRETYERRLETIVEHTNMERKDVVVPLSI